MDREGLVEPLADAGERSVGVVRLLDDVGSERLPDIRQALRDFVGTQGEIDKDRLARGAQNIRQHRRLLFEFDRKGRGALVENSAQVMCAIVDRFAQRTRALIENVGKLVGASGQS